MSTLGNVLRMLEFVGGWFLLFAVARVMVTWLRGPMSRAQRYRFLGVGFGAAVAIYAGISAYNRPPTLGTWLLLGFVYVEIAGVWPMRIGRDTPDRMRRESDWEGR